LLAATAVPPAVRAGGMPAAANALAGNAGRAKGTPASVSVDYSALDTVRPGLLVPATPDAGMPIILHPPSGVAPIRLRPPPGVRSAARPARSARAAAPKEAPKATTPPETKTAAVTPERTVAKKAMPTKPAPAVPAPAKPSAAPAPAAPKQASAPPAAPAASTAVASAQQPRSLLTPPPPPAQTAAAAPAAQPKAEETKVAALPPATAPSADPGTLRISFGVGGADLPAGAAANVKALAQRLVKDPALRVQLVAYASDPEKSISRSRRLSLERAIAVRKVLLAAGVESTRIDLRALGEQSGGGPPDRVDAITTRR
jgi:outer membrane protein OmpA-like peptidoglycan-associated protein